MINKNIYNHILSKHSFSKKDLDTFIFEKKATREGFGEALVELGKTNQNVVALCADLTESTMMNSFKDLFPNRFFEMGVAEQNMVSVASGMAAMGKLPIAASYAAFSPGRNFEQIRTTICYNNEKVVIVGAHAGLSVGPDGGSHQALEDIALMRALPNMTVLSPSDSIEAKKLLLQIENIKTPIYLRLAREKSLVIYDESYSPKIGEANIVYTGKVSDSHRQVGIVVTGPVMSEVLIAVKEIENEGITAQVLNVHTIKPIDKNKIINLAKNNNRKILTVEEHQVAGGLGSLVAEVLSSDFPSIVRRVGVKDRFGQSGKVEELYKEYGIDSDSIKKEIRELLNV